MKDTNNGYLPHDTEPTNGNGQHEERRKAFRIVPSEDPERNLNALAPQLRKKVRRDKSLTEGAKVLYDELSDLQFWPRVSPFTGVVDYAKAKLAREFGVDPKTVSRWAAQLDGRHIWTRTYFEGTIEITRWFLAGIANPQMELYEDVPSPSYGRSKTMERKERRRKPVRTIQGKFADKDGQICPKVETTAKTQQNPGKSAANGQDYPDPTDKNARRLRTKMPVDHGQKCPVSTDKNARGSRAKMPVVNGHSCPEGPDKNVRSQRAGMAELSSLKTLNKSLVPNPGGGEPPPQKDLEAEIKAWRDSLNGSFPSRLEKLREKLKTQRNNTAVAATNVRQVLAAKLKILNELLDGPLPEPVSDLPPAGPTIIEKIASREPTREEVEEGERFLAERRARGQGRATA